MGREYFHGSMCRVKYMLSPEQIQIIKRISKRKCIININNLFDYKYINDSMNKIRNVDTHSRLLYRYSKRYKYLGLNMMDAINLVLK